jgi:hypothetical protein
MLQGPVAFPGLVTVCYRSSGISRFSYCVLQVRVAYLGLAAVLQGTAAYLGLDTVLQGPVAYLGLATVCYRVQWRIYV